MINFIVCGLEGTLIDENNKTISEETIDLIATLLENDFKFAVVSGKSVHMNGAQALVYCRIRKLDSDFMRTYRQRKVITALIKKAKTSNPMTLKKLADTVLPMVQTDMSPMELTKLVFGAPKYIGYDVKSERVPHENTWKSQTKRGQSVIVTDFDANIQFLKSYLYSVDPVEDEETT